MQGRPKTPRQGPGAPLGPPGLESPIDPPAGLRVYRSNLRGTEYAVLVMPRPPHHAPRRELTRAEREVIAMATQGLSNEAIAARRRTSPRTVAAQLQSIFQKLGVSSRLELVSRTRGS